ncbi:pantoate--beta-alanine ligase [Sphingomicrobium lutaoense]|uniref:Pantothenate synthetase n=1 Tax=Sphingomicrobium lutaoense TaxID=515949 RepID=A0A839YVH2_9SPHN|nr:pantoate--beta-alanine ligase [Sphingomicrobium lutaoense]MBB3763036.1 pantoate--beta-alanine ligase [Sphingomicrobium lutaoense]
MQIIRGLKGLGGAVDALKAGGRLAMVPTMGALHDGHLALVEAGREKAGRVMASIFVNPLQFNDKDDLDRYPRQEESDAENLYAAGCDLLWIPSADDLYPEGFSTSVSVSCLTERWEGAHRPGHFDGVTTVVAKLLIAARPDMAIFGEKDFQQLAIIRRMVTDLGLPVEIVGHSTIRAADGLALSSRNALLGAEERKSAPALARSLEEAAERIRDGETPAKVLAEAKAKVSEAGFGPIDYLAYVDEATLEPLEKRRGGSRLIAAAFLGKIRLIDNLRVI